MSTCVQLQSHSASDTAAIGSAVARLAQQGDIIALQGELGAGKTQFVRGLATGMGIDPRSVSSPTFVFVQEYEPDDPEALVLVHIDAYRLQGPGDLAGIGWGDAGEDLRHQAVVAIEWADLITPALGDDWLDVRIAHAQKGRDITIEPHGKWMQRMDTLVRECAELKSD